MRARIVVVLKYRGGTFTPYVGRDRMFGRLQTVMEMRDAESRWEWYGRWGTRHLLVAFLRGK